jgi:hypothetical protein
MAVPLWAFKRHLCNLLRLFDDDDESLHLYLAWKGTCFFGQASLLLRGGVDDII